MSTTVIAALVSILAVVLPFLGVEVGTEQLTTTLTTLVVTVSGVWTWVQRVKRDDVNVAGMRK